VLITAVGRHRCWTEIFIPGLATVSGCGETACETVKSGLEKVKKRLILVLAVKVAFRYFENLSGVNFSAKKVSNMDKCPQHLMLCF
jgi:hypothetical protein